MTRKCYKCGWVSTSFFIKKKRCPRCGGQTQKFKAKKLKDLNGFVPKEEIYNC